MRLKCKPGFVLLHDWLLQLMCWEISGRIQALSAPLVMSVVGSGRLCPVPLPPPLAGGVLCPSLALRPPGGEALSPWLFVTLWCILSSFKPLERPLLRGTQVLGEVSW